MAKQDISIRKLVDKVSDGELTLPEMQRRYVWTGVKVRDLLDSLYRGYPSGTILVWETDDPRNSRKLQVDGAKTSPLSSSLLLLDGQQRITSLSAVINGEPVVVRNKKKPINILFNLEHPEHPEYLQEDTTNDRDELDEEDDDDEIDPYEEVVRKAFVVESRSLKNDPRWVSVSDIFKKTDSQILRALKITSEDERWDRYTQRLGQVRKIQDYEYVMVILDKKMSYEQVTEIFVRVNSLGAKLRGSDLALAQLTSKWKGFMEVMEAFASEFEKNEDYFHETGLMVKTLVAIVTGQTKYKTINRYPLDDYKKAWGVTEEALRFAYNFISNNARIDNFRIISPFLLVPIAYYSMLKKGNLNNKEDNQMLLWFYVSLMKGRYSRGSSESILDSDLSILKSHQNLGSLLEHLKVQVRDFYVNEAEIRFKNRRSTYFSMLFLIAKQRGVKDWFSGVGISEKTTGRSHAVQFHHIMPKSLLRDLGYDRRSINDIANLTFIGGKTNRSISNKQPHIYIKDILEKRGETIFKDNHIPTDRSLWEIKNFEAFLEYRRNELVKTLNGFIKEIERKI